MNVASGKDEEGYQQVPGEKQLHPVEQANIIERWFFTWVTPLITLGSTRPLESEDFPVLPQEIRMSNLYEHISRVWAQEMQSNNPRFGTALINAFWRKFAQSALWNIPVSYLFSSFFCSVLFCSVLFCSVLSSVFI